MKIVSIIGARPQFIKCAPVSRALQHVASEVLVHTGQHYDDSMSGVFFRELGITEPDYHLGVGSGSHGRQTGDMLKGVEEILLKEAPEMVLVYGDTNSTLAGALAAVKLHVPVVHVEAGLRSFNRRMPEEINRLVTDQLSALLLCPTDTAVENLRREGVTEGVYLVGDVMYDALMDSVERAQQASTILERLGVTPQGYLLATVHRADNTDRFTHLGGILSALSRLAGPDRIVVFPVHPRTRKQLEHISFPASPYLLLIDPVSYLDMVRLERNAQAILTDSGGIQKEAYWLGVPCITLREETEWVETVASGWNCLVGAATDQIVSAVCAARPGRIDMWPYSRGEASASVAQRIASFASDRRTGAFVSGRWPIQEDTVCSTHRVTHRLNP